MNGNNPSKKKVMWLQPDGSPVSCEEKLKVLNENLAEIHQYCEDALEDALLMGCDEKQVREAFASVLQSIGKPLKNKK